VYAFVNADAGDSPIAETLIWERFLERAWAVIVIDFLVNDLATIALAYSTSSAPLELLIGLLAFALSILTVFADTSATVDDDVTVWTVVPLGIMRSAATTWNTTTFVRALAIFALQMLAFAVQEVLYFGLQHWGVPQALFWSQIPLETIVAPPLAAITLLVYRDAKTVLR
jgi:hypothetical protein